MLSVAISLFDFFCRFASFLMFKIDFISFNFDLLPLVPSLIPFFDAYGGTISRLGKTYK